MLTPLFDNRQAAWIVRGAAPSSWLFQARFTTERAAREAGEAYLQSLGLEALRVLVARARKASDEDRCTCCGGPLPEGDQIPHLHRVKSGEFVRMDIVVEPKVDDGWHPICETCSLQPSWQGYVMVL